MFKFLFVCRAEGILNRGNVDAFALEESQNLSIFFATNNSITLYLKKYLEEVGSHPMNASFPLQECRELPTFLPSIAPLVHVTKPDHGVLVLKYTCTARKKHGVRSAAAAATV